MFRKITLLFLGLFLSGLFLGAFAQALSVSGKVSNKTTGEALPGATIAIEGEKASVVSDVNGAFSIKAQRGATLLITYAGMAPVRHHSTAAHASDYFYCNYRTSI